MPPRRTVGLVRAAQADMDSTASQVMPSVALPHSDCILEPLEAFLGNPSDAWGSQLIGFPRMASKGSIHCAAVHAREEEQEAREAEQRQT